MFNSGDAAFSAPVEIAASASSLGSLLVADMDGDTDLDVITLIYHDDPYVHAIRVLLNDGSGAFTASPEIPLPSAACGAVVGDIDGDGDADLLITLCYFGSKLLVTFLNDGAGKLSEARSHQLRKFPSPQALADLDGDGDLDLVLRGVSEFRLDVLLNNGDGTFEQGAVFHTDGDWPRALVGDLDGTGTLDLIVIDRDYDRIAVILNPLSP